MKALARKRKPPSNESATAIEISSTLKIMMLGYIVWYALYFVLGVATVALPGLAAMGIGDDITRKILSGSGAISAAIFAFLRPHEIAGAYDAALQKVWQVEIAYNLGLLTPEAVSEGLVDAVKRSTFQYAAPAGAQPIGPATQHATLASKKG